MKVRLLGTAAGGAFPQWNCGCANCRAVREGASAFRQRSQVEVAVSADGARWFLLGASPDLRTQIESFPPLWPRAPRGTPIEGVLLTSGDLDKVLGLWLLREGGRMPVHATARLRDTLERGLRLPSGLERWSGFDWREPPPTLAPLLDSRGAESGLAYAAFPVPGKPPRYLEGAPSAAGDCIGYRIVDRTTAGRLVFIPDLAAVDAVVTREIAGCDALLVDGTFWTEDEMAPFGGRPAAAMAHVPVRESLPALAASRARHRLFVHVNNTNPILREGSPEAAAVAAAGFAVGIDGQEIDL